MKIYLPFLLMMSIHSFAMHQKEQIDTNSLKVELGIESRSSNINSKENESLEMDEREQQVVIDFLLEEFWLSSPSVDSSNQEELGTTSFEAKQLNLEFVKEDLYKIEQNQSLRVPFVRHVSNMHSYH